MARMPGAIWRPIPASTARIKSYDILCVHTMVGTLAGTDGYFKRIAPGVNSHFGTGPDGTIYQWVDTAFQSGANLNGNHHVISIENADMGAPFPAWGGSDVPALTPQQVEANAKIAAWANHEHGIPLTLIPDAKPGRRGIGYHRQGVPGYMVAGAEKWSNAQGKACPGNRRIAQIPQIISRAQQLLGGAAPINPEDDDMLYRELMYDTKFRGDRNYAQVVHNIEDLASNAAAAAERAAQAAEQAAAGGQGGAVSVDAAAVAAALASNHEFLTAIAKVVADENARRQAS